LIYVNNKNGLHLDKFYRRQEMILSNILKRIKGLPPLQQLIYLYLSNSNRCGYFYDTPEDLASSCGICSSTVCKHLKELTRKQFIKKERGAWILLEEGTQSKRAIPDYLV
jgi:DNA-binding MarR family transcriptional regulator